MAGPIGLPIKQILYVPVIKHLSRFQNLRFNTMVKIASHLKWLRQRRRDRLMYMYNIYEHNPYDVQGQSDDAEVLPTGYPICGAAHAGSCRRENPRHGGASRAVKSPLFIPQLANITHSFVFDKILLRCV